MYVLSRKVLALVLLGAFMFTFFALPPGGEGADTYVVRAGECLWVIAQKCGSTAAALKAANNLNSNIIYPGQHLVLPGKEKKEKLELQNGDTIWTVKSKDTLWNLSQRFGVTMADIKKRSHLHSNTLEVGQELIIPCKNLLPPPPLKKASNTDLYWLARAISAEARGESLEGQIAVGAVVLNRAKSPLFPDTISGVIFQKVGGTHQFSVVADGSIYQAPTPRALEAARLALAGRDPTQGSLYFYNPQLTSRKNWVRSRQVARVIGRHVFAF